MLCPMSLILAKMKHLLANQNTVRVNPPRDKGTLIAILDGLPIMNNFNS